MTAYSMDVSELAYFSTTTRWKGAVNGMGWCSSRLHSRFHSGALTRVYRHTGQLPSRVSISISGSISGRPPPLTYLIHRVRLHAVFGTLHIASTVIRMIWEKE